MRIVADQNIACVAEAFAGLGDVEMVAGRTITPATVENADLLLVRSVTRVDAGLLGGSRVRFVATATSGVDHVDVDYLNERGIGFAAAPGSNAESVAEYVLSAVLAWGAREGRSLHGLTAAVIGCGEVGSRVIAKFEALGIDCLCNDPPLRERSGDPKYRQLDEVLGADIVTLHVPLRRDGAHPTWRLLNEARLGRLNPHAILINTARGGVLDEAALLRLAGAPAHLVIDCWEHEPAIDAALLERADLATAHIAGYSHDGKLRATEMIHRAVCDWFGHAPSWHAPAAADSADGTAITVTDAPEEEEVVRRVVWGCYDVRDDSERLKLALTLAQAERGAFFDRLRRDYPRRREFDSVRVQVPASRAALAARLRALGFTVVPFPLAGEGSKPPP